MRQRALEDGKTVYMAVPRLADEQPFFLLDPVDLVVTGCVAVDESGARLGLVVTPERVIDCRRGRRDRPPVPRIRWEQLTDHKIASIPLLTRLSERRRM